MSNLLMLLRTIIPVRASNGYLAPGVLSRKCGVGKACSNATKSSLRRCSKGRKSCTPWIKRQDHIPSTSPKTWPFIKWSLKAGGSKTGREKNGVSDWGVFLGHSVERNEVSRTLKVNMEWSPWKASAANSNQKNIPSLQKASVKMTHPFLAS